MTLDPGHADPTLPPPAYATAGTAGTAPALPAAGHRYPVLSNRVIGWAALVLIVIGAGLAVGLLIAFGNGEHPAQLDAIKTAGTIVLGTGGAAALWLTARRQQTSEIALNQKHLDQVAAELAFAFQQRQAADTRAHLNGSRPLPRPAGSPTCTPKPSSNSARTRPGPARWAGPHSTRRAGGVGWCSSPLQTRSCRVLAPDNPRRRSTDTPSGQ
jgi:hypothetical protein